MKHRDNKLDRYDLEAFLNDHPLMAVRPDGGPGVRLAGTFLFSARHAQHGEVKDRFKLAINIPPGFPRSLPSVEETGGRIPRSASWHINPDGTLCLGSPLRLMVLFSDRPTLMGFVERCLIPYLYAVSIKLERGGPLLFDELAHGVEGILDDLAQMLKLKDRNQARVALESLGKKKRRANKTPCPCGCGKRLGRCGLHHRLNPLRFLASRSMFRGFAQQYRHAPPRP